MNSTASNPTPSPRKKPNKLALGFGGLLVALLLAAVFTLGSLRIPFEPDRWQELLILYALSTFIVAALMVFGLILVRSLLRTWAERRAEKLGGHFKAKMVAGAMAISLLPVVFMFLISYALLNRTLNRWFPRPLEVAVEESQRLVFEMGRAQLERLKEIGLDADQDYPHPDDTPKAVQSAMHVAGDAAWMLDSEGRVLLARGLFLQPGGAGGSSHAAIAQTISPSFLEKLPSGVEVWQASGTLYLAGRTPRQDGELVVGRRVPDDFLSRFKDIHAQAATYDAAKQGLRAFKNLMLLILALFTVLLLFSSTWFALFLSKQVTVPIQALAAATQEISRGNFDYRVDAHARDELGVLVSSFNEMTTQLADSRNQINDFTRNLQDAVAELERRRKLIEAILENIPTAVLSLDDAGAILKTNPSVAKIFGDASRHSKRLEDLVGEEASRGVQFLMRKSLRMGTASKELEIELPGRVLHAAVTVSSLGPRRANPGFIVVIDDLSELLRAQKAAAWQEVAQRIAHEIKNPLTPIQLSAQRLSRFLEKHHADGQPVREFEKLAGECAGLIQREVSTLKALVDEFSQFARFPSVKPVPSDLNSIVTSALDVFGGRLEGVTLRTDFAQGLPPVKADPELLRRVLVNLIDNAAEAMEGASVRELRVTTRLDAEGETFEIIVADSGHGISPEDKDRLFLPHFSTRDRGTGLGLAIASRIVAEHNGTIYVEDNVPFGARFLIRLPVAEVHAAPAETD